MKILAIAGSLRKESYNRKVLQIAKQIASEAGATVSEFDLKDAALPVFDADIEAEGMPASVEALRSAIQSVDVLLIATPEYNRSVPGGFKNAIDWASRKPNVLDGKIAAMFGASPGRFGTVRSQLHLREILTALNVFVTPNPEVYLSSINDESFDEDGLLVDQDSQQLLETLIQNTLNLSSKIHA